ncbi:MAG: O-methyltransferase [Candidatus Sericytochromatia bacterium]
MIDPIVFDKSLSSYITSLLPDLHPVLKKIENKARNEGQPVVSNDAGTFLNFMVRLKKPKRILEVGCNIGYSALWQALALEEGAFLDTIDIREDLGNIARENFIEAGVSDKVNIHIGPALDVIKTLDYEYDIVFIDAVKKQYIAYLDLILPKLKKGSLVFVDNTLWSGRVLDEEKDENTQALDDFNKYLAKHSAFDSMLLSIGDGLSFAIVK